MGEIRSMTGFGRASGDLSPRWAASLVVRSVNHRYLDVHVRTNLREELPEAELAVREEIARDLRRGRVQVQLTLQRLRPAAARVMVEGDAVRGLLEQLAAIELPPEVAGGVALGDVLGLPGLVSVATEESLLGDEEIAGLVELARSATADLVAMRRHEGAALVGQLEAELDALGGFLAWLEPELPRLREQAAARLKERLEELVGGEIEPQRLLQEAAIGADRADVAEETVRLGAHLKHFRERLATGGSVGRQLDFLCQEINRELNTLGAKSREPEVAQRLVEAKTGAERLREQVQNLE